MFMIVKYYGSPAYVSAQYPILERAYYVADWDDADATLINHFGGDYYSFRFVMPDGTPVSDEMI